MEAELVDEIPVGPEWVYEPKWDGFRCLAFRDGDELELQSKAGQPLTRYFPEIVSALRTLPAERFVLDGELAIPAGDRLSFDDLLQRIHPAESRVRKLAEETPALYILFDLLVDADGAVLAGRPLRERRQALETFAARCIPAKGDLRLSPTAGDIEQARRWFESVNGSLDGVIAKRLDCPYQPGERTGAVQKIKSVRTADCVVGGFRYGTSGGQVGSILLGLYEDGLLHHVGFSSSFTAAERQELTKALGPLIEEPGFTGRKPGGPSRWSTRRTDDWRPVKPVLVAEVKYDHFTGGRFRHGTQVLRWRPDKAPQDCTMDQVAQAEGAALRLLG
jgi:ATP-dependent DNA ligase